jgi:hypothetical protein
MKRSKFSEHQNIASLKSSGSRTTAQPFSKTANYIRDEVAVLRENVI